ncbi:N-acetylmuramoyl-L-alanine amidase [Pleurocapsa sp. FMAR1]|uniref:N-acetylmuramoyl-L-alanine amidase n=1 Tax=Pleurocapsa sp. FMAR1 TaxID=3040204 RepID=UPI0029C83177|nr:N-acetylmuramoyl-L-alanine amidase [Pleurocapsa sp. FMAR1]
MKFHWLLSSFIGVFLFCSPARAGKIVSWEFEEQDQNLEFTTDEGVQPEAQLLSNPTRLVIDLPRTTLDRETVKEEYQGPIRGFRIGQPESDISRLVVEFAPGYTIDADDIKFKEDSGTEWKVEIPQPRIYRVDIADRDLDPIDLEVPEVDIASSLSGLEDVAASMENVSTNTNTETDTGSPYIKATKNGFFINIDGSRKIKIDSRRDGDRIDFFLEGITLPDDLDNEEVAVNQYGVSTIDFEQVDDDQAKMSLTVAKDSPEWLATFSRIKGLLLLPKGELPASSTLATTLDNSQPQEIIPKPDKPLKDLTELSLIDEIELKNDDTELLVKGNNELLAATTRLSNGIYQVTIDNAALTEDFKGPEFEADSPVSELRVREENSRVVLEIATRLRYRLGQLDADSDNLSLPIEIGADPLPQSDAPLLPPGFAKAPKKNFFPTVSAPIPNSDRPRVVIDPGHGGYDSGAIGIDGLQEKDVILPIGLDVAEILGKQGIDVIMTRDNDNFISLEGRTDLANDLDADLFVSIHANSINLTRPDVNGLETYYYESGRRLAELIHYSILNGVNIDDRGIRRARFYVLRHSLAPAVLVEVGFVTGADDASRLKDSNHRRQMAEAIARGIIEYIKQNNL